MAFKITRLVVFVVLAVGGAVGLRYLDQRRMSNLDLERSQARVRELEQEKKAREAYITRITADFRKANLLVIDQSSRPGDQRLWTTFLFVPMDRNGKPRQAKTITVQGDEAHIDSVVLRFPPEMIGRDDPLRGHNLVMFYRAYGRNQSPGEGFPLDVSRLGEIPEFARTPDANDAQATFERDLWQNLWTLIEDENLRKTKGVSVSLEGPWVFMRPGQRYEVDLQAIGGLSIKSAPMNPEWTAFRDAVVKSREQ